MGNNLMQVAADMGDLAAAGINSFKFFLAYKGAFAVTDAQLLKGLARCKELGALPMVTPSFPEPLGFFDSYGSSTGAQVSGALQGTRRAARGMPPSFVTLLGIQILW